MACKAGFQSYQPHIENGPNILEPRNRLQGRMQILATRVTWIRSPVISTPPSSGTLVGAENTSCRRQAIRAGRTCLLLYGGSVRKAGIQGVDRPGSKGVLRSARWNFCFLQEPAALPGLCFAPEILARSHGNQPNAGGRSVEALAA